MASDAGRLLPMVAGERRRSGEKVIKEVSGEGDREYGLSSSPSRGMEMRDTKDVRKGIKSMGAGT